MWNCGFRYYKDESRQPVYYEESRPTPWPLERPETHLRGRQLPPGEAPTHARTVHPRRQVIVLE
jgi:hypothetical protein